MKGKEHLVFNTYRDGEVIVREGSCFKGSHTTQVSAMTANNRSWLNCDNLYVINDKRRCRINEGSCGINLDVILPTFHQKQELKVKTDITSAHGLINLSDRLRDLIHKRSYFIDVPGQGGTYTTEVKFPDGDKGELGWARFRDEEGALVWTKGIDLEGGPSLIKGDYCVMYIHPYGKHVRLAELRNEGKEVLGIDIEDVVDLQSLITDSE